MAFECARARSLFERGLPLAGMLARREGREVRLFAGGGLAILDRLAAADYDVFTARPALSRWAKIGLVARALVGADR
jgi:phytoene/squalene synthetase